MADKIKMQGLRVLVTGSSGFIGAALIESLIRQNATVLGIDIRKPMYRNHFSVWKKVDILDRDALLKAAESFSPTHVIHLAARTDLGLGETVDGFKVNTEGVRNVLEVCRRTRSVKMVLFTSTILIFKAGYIPETEFDYCPNTPYGESKVVGEKIVREVAKGAEFTWCIVRPTSIWGPGYGSHYVKFFKMVSRGIYLHPGTAENRVVYGYLGNCVYQIETIMTSSSEKVHGRVFYLGDYWATNIREWVKQIQLEIGKGRLITLPGFLAKAAALCGDMLWHIGWKKVPFNSFRLKNMSTDRLIDTTKTKELVGRLPFTQEQGVSETIEWLRAGKN